MMSFLFLWVYSENLTHIDWFLDVMFLTTIENFEYLNTKNVMNMQQMSCACTSLTSLDLSSFDTQSVISGFLLDNCPSLDNLKISASLGKIIENNGLEG